MIRYRLVLATQEEETIYGKSSVGSGLSSDLRYLEKDPLAAKERGNSRSLRYDHMHLSVPDTDPTLVQWWGRSASGYHYPVGSVMKMIPTEED